MSLAASSARYRPFFRKKVTSRYSKRVKNGAWLACSQRFDGVIILYARTANISTVHILYEHTWKDPSRQTKQHLSHQIKATTTSIRNNAIALALANSLGPKINQILELP